MDSDFETGPAYRYTVGQFMKLNNAKVKLPANISDIVGKYSMPDCCKEHPYYNKYNIRFYNKPVDAPEPKRRLITRNKDDAFNDSNILSELRHAFSSVVKGSGGTVHSIAKISQILIPITMVDEVANLFFDVIIQSPKQMPEYLHVLFGFTQPGDLHREIQYKFAKKVMNVFKEPPVLPASLLESGEDRTKRHRLTTCQLIASLFIYEFDPEGNPSHVVPHKTFSNTSMLKERVINPLLAQAKTEVDAIKNLASVWSILQPRYPSVLAEYKEDLIGIYKDPKFKLTSRIALKDFCE